MLCTGATYGKKKTEVYWENEYEEMNTNRLFAGIIIEKFLVASMF